MKIELTNAKGYSEFLGNLIYNKKCTVEDIYDAAEDSETGEQFEYYINSLDLLHKFWLDRETDSYIRLKTRDRLGNVHYLKKYR